MAVIWLVAWVVVTAGGMRAARHRARTAADLAALAAASRVADGRAVACSKARVVARENGGRLTRCGFDGRVADVVVAVRFQAPADLGMSSITAHARAGRAGPPEVSEGADSHE